MERFILQTTCNKLLTENYNACNKDAHIFERQSSRTKEFILGINKKSNVPLQDKLVGELKCTPIVQIEIHLEVWFNMSMWDWIVLEDDHLMPL